MSLLSSRAYSLLVTIRVLFAFLGHGYIHPDEYFQNGEVIAGAIFQWHHLRTWEWDSAFPCRSILPPFLTTGPPLALLNAAFAGNTSSRMVFLAERLSSLVLSFVLDICVAQLVPLARAKALLLLASSHVLMTFQVRPFSNSLEANLVAAALAVLGHMLSHRRGDATVNRTSFSAQASMLAVILVIGSMTRITFVAFALPVALQALFLSLQLAKISGRFSLVRWIKSVTVPLCVGFVALYGAVALDSVYFLGSLGRQVFTPYNNLLYNISADNLAKHGLHPRWLHVAVNLPMMVGPGLVIYGLLAAKRVLTASWLDTTKHQPSSQLVVNRTCIWTIGLSLAVLSLQPHQESRFLAPLLVPFVVLVANSGYLNEANRLFWISWIVGNVFMSLLFGVLHQGGVVRSLFHLNSLISLRATPGNYGIVYWKTYMPPWHLLGVPEHEIQSGRVFVTDLSGRSSDEAQEFLLSLPGHHSETTTLYLVTPEFAMQSLAPSIERCFKTDRRVYPHLDLDHISESVEAGWPTCFALGVYKADLDCVAS
ncbi:Alg9-like mannosyltransferase family-domain-containing protein [Cytidiella melzeri]|nr:Alg9-like mannosyltransferase family-domain-containing protein [Cytidiella melzeri]